MQTARKAAVYILLVGVYGFTYLVALLGSVIPRRPWKPTGRIMVTGTFHNPGWYLSHVIPLSRSGVKEVILVIDEPQLPLEKVRFVCPPKWLARIISRAGAKAIWIIIAGLRYRPDLYMGYHIVPGACIALVAGKLMGRPVCYQMTGAPVGLIGGFPEIVCSFGSSASPSKFIEKMVLGVVRRFDCVVVRGNKSKEYLQAHGVTSPIRIITGSVRSCRQSPQVDRRIHLIFVGRLSPIKQVDQFITIVGAVARVVPTVRASIVGDGPLLIDLQAYTEKMGLSENIDFLGKRKDVEVFLAHSKIFVLTSKTEGLSVAMAEAMACGVVPVVADLGELGDLVVDGVNGYLIEPNNIDEYTNRIVSLLQNQALWGKCSNRAIETAISHCDVEVITERWRQYIQDAVSQASGSIKQKVLS